TSEIYSGLIRVLHNAMPKFLGSLGMKYGFGQEEFERGMK
ncbi:hypothetical protein Tco_0042993, partial [Tanacetum coccineum]